jgi:hypothetical protein
MRVIGKVVTALLLALVFLVASKVYAHATCWDSGCCSPHGQGFSDSGYTFGQCNHVTTWNRSAWGPPTSACSGYSNSCVNAYADQNHNVTMWLNFCSSGSYDDQVCCLYNWCCGGGPC